MTDPFPYRVRYKLILPKRRVVLIEEKEPGTHISVYSHGITEIIHCPIPPDKLDLRKDDLLTFYTELLANADA